MSRRFPLGIEVFDNPGDDEGFFSCIIERNTTVPVNNTKTYTNLYDDQTGMNIVVLQGVESRARANKVLGEYTMSGLTPRPRGQTKIDIQFDIDSDGIIHISAKEQNTDRELNVTVEGHSALNQDDLDKMADSAKRDLERLK